MLQHCCSARCSWLSLTHRDPSINFLDIIKAPESCYRPFNLDLGGVAAGTASRMVSEAGGTALRRARADHPR